MWHVMYRVTSYLPTGIRVHSSPRALSLSPVLTTFGVRDVIQRAAACVTVTAADSAVVDAFVESPDGDVTVYVAPVA